MSVRVRFAPSPTGLLHVGNVRTALFNWLFARQCDGVLILRIEDTDVERSEKRFEDQLQRDLRWLGLNWDEGADVGGPHGPYRQTERLAIYRRVAQDLLDDGRAYHCFCTQQTLVGVRREQLTRGQSPRYPGTCRDLEPETSAKRVASGEPAVLRFKVRKGEISFSDLVFGELAIDSREVGDFVLLRSDGSAQYNFAVVVDDMLMKVSHVIRGEGHISNNHRQILIYEALGEQPPCFAHLSTIRALDGTKLSKRHGSVSVQEFRRQGYLPEALLNCLALLGWSPEEDGSELLEPSELVTRFRLERVNRAPAIFDGDKLKWLNRQYLGRLAPRRLANLAVPHLVSQNWVTLPVAPAGQKWLESLVEGLKQYLNKAEDIVEAGAVIFDFCPERDLTDDEVALLRTQGTSYRVLLELQKQTGETNVFTAEAFDSLVTRIRDTVGVKGKALFHPLRLALTGKASGPDLKVIVPLIEEGSRLDFQQPIPGISERISRLLSHLS